MAAFNLIAQITMTWMNENIHRHTVAVRLGWVRLQGRIWLGPHEGRYYKKAVRGTFDPGELVQGPCDQLGPVLLVSTVC